MPLLISGRRRIVAAVSHVMKLIVAATFDRRNTVLVDFFTTQFLIHP